MFYYIQIVFHAISKDLSQPLRAKDVIISETRHDTKATLLLVKFSLFEHSSGVYLTL